MHAKIYNKNRPEALLNARRSDRGTANWGQLKLDVNEYISIF